MVVVGIIGLAFAGLFVFSADRAAWDDENDAEKVPVPVPVDDDSIESRLRNL
ncbi:hypothetical protein [Bifidobacterium choloepi]|uniref:hypothetical protein n=1 Tax=Bifidobacterium choloepi TaxID=2614131 RepID=UPI0013D16485|nr:hypothetical protein [Bifidobacterium choloepi]